MESDKESGNEIGYKILVSDSEIRNKNHKNTFKYKISEWFLQNKARRYFATGGYSLILLPGIIITLLTKPGTLIVGSGKWWFMLVDFMIALACLIMFNVWITIIPVDKNRNLCYSAGDYTRAFIWGVCPCIVLAVLTMQY